MSRRCELTGKGTQVGHNVSHANNKTKRIYRPNLQTIALASEILGNSYKLRISMNALRSVDRNGEVSMRPRLTNGFSTKLENHPAMVALYFMYYNFGRVHQTLRVTPAMEAGIVDHVWSIEEIVGLLG